MRKDISISRAQVARYFRSRYFEDLDRVYDIRSGNDGILAAPSMSLDGRRPDFFRFCHEEEFFMFSAITAYILNFERALSVVILDERVPTGNNYYIVNDFAKISGIPVFLFGLAGLHPSLEHLIRGAGLFSDFDCFRSKRITVKENYLAVAKVAFPFMEVMFEAFLMGAVLPIDEHDTWRFRFHDGRDYDAFVEKVSGHCDEVVTLMKSEIRRFVELFKEQPMKEHE